MVSLYSARSQTVSGTSGGFAAFDGLKIAPHPAIARAEAALAAAEEKAAAPPLEPPPPRPAYIPKHELARQRRREENSPRAALAALRAREEAEDSA